jgi:hypothetical protein
MYRIIGTDVVMFVAYEPSTYEDHSTITYHNDVLLGEVGCHRYPGNEPYGSQERIERASKWYDNNRDMAKYLIRKAFPEYADRIEFYSNGTGIMTDNSVANEWRWVSW